MNDLENIVYLTVCGPCTDTTCSGDEGIGGGQRLLSHIENQLNDHPYKNVISVSARRCLMACSNGCTVAFATRGKMRYLLGNMPATEDTAAQLLDFAAIYSESDTGVCPNHEWPGKLAMHFIGRMPPLDPAEGNWNEEGCNL